VRGGGVGSHDSRCDEVQIIVERITRTRFSQWGLTSIDFGGLHDVCWSRSSPIPHTSEVYVQTELKSREDMPRNGRLHPSAMPSLARRGVSLSIYYCPIHCCEGLK